MVVKSNYGDQNSFFSFHPAFVRLSRTELSTLYILYKWSTWSWHPIKVYSFFFFLGPLITTKLVNKTELSTVYEKKLWLPHYPHHAQSCKSSCSATRANFTDMGSAQRPNICPPLENASVHVIKMQRATITMSFYINESFRALNPVLWQVWGNQLRWYFEGRSSQRWVCE